MKEVKNLRVLVVDDDKVVRDFFSRLLRLHNLEVVTAEDGYKAIDLIQKDPLINLIFLDVRMPGLDGLETYRKLRQFNRNAEIVMMTGYAEDEILKKAQQEGAYASIRKPFDIMQLKDIIDAVKTEKIKRDLNILVIDDEEIILNFFAGLFQERKQKYKVARNKQEVLSIIKKERFDLIFLDLVLKDTNGIELYKEIKDISPDTEIILITGYPQKAEEIKEKIKIAGCLYKPFDIQKIFEYINKAELKYNG